MNEPDDGTTARSWSPAIGPLRGRVLIAFVLLLVVSGGLATLSVRTVLELRLEDEMGRQLSQEVAEFNRLLIVGADPQASQRSFTSLSEAFDTFLTGNVPGNEEGFAAFLEGRPYRSTLNRFPLDRLPEEIVTRYGSGTSPLAEDAQPGRLETELGPVYYRALPVQVGGQDGTFVVIILPAGEVAEIRELERYGVAAVLVVLALGLGMVWFVLNRLLRPVEHLTWTAQLISQSDLTRRVEIRGSGEAANMARTFNAMLDRLQAVFRREQDFVRDTSHELRVPLTVCLGNLDLLAMTMPDPDPERVQVLALIGDELERMARIVDDLRLLADAGHPDFLQPESLQLADLVADLRAKSRTLGERSWLTEVVHDGIVTGDRHRLTEAVMNLVDNAVRHTTDGDVIAIGADVAPGEARLWVRDTGSGIPPTEQARIFDRFRRGSRAYRTYRGSGLGLSIVRAIAEAHRGRVELDSGTGAGSTFTLVLPRDPT